MASASATSHVRRARKTLGNDKPTREWTSLMSGNQQKWSSNLKILLVEKVGEVLHGDRGLVYPSECGRVSSERGITAKSQGGRHPKGNIRMLLLRGASSVRE